jgi:hypothetical protein
MAVPTLLGHLEKPNLNHWSSDRVGAIIILPEERSRSRFQNVVFLRNIRGWTKSKNMIISSAIQHCQNPLQLIREL